MSKALLCSLQCKILAGAKWSFQEQDGECQSKHSRLLFAHSMDSYEATSRTGSQENQTEGRCT
jgi:hypothetical protein